MDSYLNESIKILVVDDDPLLLDLTKRLLVKENYFVRTAKNGHECLQAIQKNKPDILLLDVMLPDISGVDLCRSIKHNPALASIYIFLISGLKTKSDNISEGLETGADGYLIKPLNNRELLARVGSLCRIINAERKTSAALMKYHSLFSSMQEGVYLHELVYDEHGKAVDYRIIEANPASEIQINIKTEDAVGKLASELYNTPVVPFLEIYTHVAETGNGIVFEEYFAPMDKYFQVSVFSPGNGMFATAFTDITIRKKAEEKLKIQNATLLKLNTEKDKFFSIIAHDLRSPFNSIIGLSEILAEQVGEKNYESIDKYAGIILQSSHRAMDLLTNLMIWAQSQTGRMEFNPKHFELVDIINKVNAPLDAIAEQKSITIIKDLPQKMYVFADKDMLGTILRNLISNAIKFSKIGGEIIVSAQLNANEVIVSVSDNGIGITKDNLEKLFRIDESYTTLGTNMEKGTGLGLILCKEFIDKHNGRIWAESKEGKGSTFNFTIPC